jgi:hypothetical protein
MKGGSGSPSAPASGAFERALPAPLGLFPAASVNVAASLSLSESRRRMARRALAASLPRRVFPAPAATEPLAFAMTVFRRNPSAFASFRVTRTWTLAEHASSQVTLTGTRPLLTIFARLRVPSRIVPLGAVRSAAITAVGCESDEADRPARVAVTRACSVEPTSSPAGV